MRKLLVASCVLFLLAGTLIVIGCRGGGNGGPKDVAQEFLDSFKAQDYDAFLATLSESDKELFEQNAEEAKEYFKTITEAPVDVEIGKEEIKGDEATVEVSKEEKGEKQTAKFHFVKENGKWKIDFMKTSEAL